MILQLTPDYTNKPLYSNLFEAIRLQPHAYEQLVYACDNATHQIQTYPKNIYITNRRFSVLERVLFFPKQRYLLRDIEQRLPLQQIQLIHAHTLFSSGYTSYKLYQKYGIPYVVVVRNTDVNVFFKYMPHLIPIGKEIARHAEKIIFISPAYRQQVMGQYLPKEWEAKAVVIPNGIESMFLENISRHMSSENAIRLIYVGRIEKNKNIETIIKVADRLIEKGKNVHLCIVGKIIHRAYRSLIESRSYTEWHDECPKEEVMTFLRQSDILIMPSYHETFGLVYAEAMTQGLPIIYTKGQGFDAFFEDGIVGFHSAPDDVEYMTTCIIRILNNYASFSQRCNSLVTQFDWRQIATKYNNIYNDILTN